NRIGQGEHSRERTVHPLNLVIALLVSFELALALQVECVVLEPNVDFTWIHTGQLDCQDQVLVCLADVHRRSPGSSTCFGPRCTRKRLVEQPVELILRRYQISEWF